jgi:hypothetical protein
MYIKANEICKIAKNEFGKYVYSTGVHLSTLVSLLCVFSFLAESEFCDAVPILGTF